MHRNTGIQYYCPLGSEPPRSSLAVGRSGRMQALYESSLQRPRETDANAKSTYRVAGRGQQKEMADTCTVFYPVSYPVSSLTIELRRVTGQNWPSAIQLPVFSFDRQGHSAFSTGLLKGTASLPRCALICTIARFLAPLSGFRVYVPQGSGFGAWGLEWRVQGFRVQGLGRPSEELCS